MHAFRVNKTPLQTELMLCFYKQSSLSSLLLCPLIVNTWASETIAGAVSLGRGVGKGHEEAILCYFILLSFMLQVVYSSVFFKKGWGNIDNFSEKACTISFKQALVILVFLICPQRQISGFDEILGGVYVCVCVYS